MFHRRKTYDVENHKDESNNTTTENGTFYMYKGLLLAMLGGFFFSIVAVIVKQIGNIHPGQLVVYRYVAFFAFSIPGSVKSQENLRGPQNQRFLLLLVRGLFCATNSFLIYIAFRYLPLGESAVIIYSLPVFVTLAARLYLKEPCGLIQTITVLTTVVGIVFTTKLPLILFVNSMKYTKKSVWGLLAALGSLFTGTYQSIATRGLKDVHSSVILFNFGWVAVVESAILAAAVGDFSRHHRGLQSFFILALCVLSYGGQAMITMALLCEMAGPVMTVMSSASIVLAFVWQALLFKDVPDVSSAVGAFLVGLSVVILGVRKWVSSLPPDSTYRRKLRWMLK